MLIAVTKVDVQSANANQDTKAILTPVAFVAIVFPILNAETIKLVKITSVSILVNCLVDQVLIAKWTIMSLSVDVLVDSLEIHSKYECFNSLWHTDLTYMFKSFINNSVSNTAVCLFIFNFINSIIIQVFVYISTIYLYFGYLFTL